MVEDFLLLKLLGHARAKGSVAAQLCVVVGEFFPEPLLVSASSSLP